PSSSPRPPSRATPSWPGSASAVPTPPASASSPSTAPAAPATTAAGPPATSSTPLRTSPPPRPPAPSLGRRASPPSPAPTPSPRPRRWSGVAEQRPAAFWEAHSGAVDRVWSGRPNSAVVDVAGGLPPGRVLGLGCGEGGDAVWLAGRGWDVTAVDISP